MAGFVAGLVSEDGYFGHCPLLGVIAMITLIDSRSFRYTPFLASSNPTPSSSFLSQNSLLPFHQSDLCPTFLT